MVQPSGNIFYKDDFGQLYQVEWSTVNGLMDITSIVSQPYVWGQKPNGYVINNTIFRYGVITITRQIIRHFDGGYEIIAEGVSQILDFFQTTFPCQVGPVDSFKYHLDCGIVDETMFKTTIGPRWADPDDSNDEEMVWGVVDSDGSPGDATSTSGTTTLEWVDIWTN